MGDGPQALKHAFYWCVGSRGSGTGYRAEKTVSSLLHFFWGVESFPGGWAPGISALFLSEPSSQLKC